MLLLAGALPCLVALLKSADHGLQHQAVQVLRQMTFCREENVAAVISAGVLFCTAHECLLPMSKQLELFKRPWSACAIIVVSACYDVQVACCTH